jgi:hypothetical protein
MNPLLILQILMMLPSLVAVIESIVPVSDQGPEKLKVVVNAVTPLVPAEEFPDFEANVLPKIEKFVAVLVVLYKLAGFFKRVPA